MHVCLCTLVWVYCVAGLSSKVGSGEVMILDAIIGLFVSLFEVLIGGAAIVFVPVINLILAGVEALVSLFVSGFTLGRIERKKGKKRSSIQTTLNAVLLLCILFALGWVFLGPKVMNRSVTFVAEDGYSLPFAAAIIHTKESDQHVRSDNAGNLVIPRFGTTGITIKDPRYIEKTWSQEEIGAELIVGRTVLGAGLDSLAEGLLKPVGE